MNREESIIKCAEKTIDFYKALLKDKGPSNVYAFGSPVTCAYCKEFKFYEDTEEFFHCNNCPLSNGKYVGCTKIKSYKNLEFAVERYDREVFINGEPSGILSLELDKFLRKRILFHRGVISRSKQRLSKVGS